MTELLDCQNGHSICNFGLLLFLLKATGLLVVSWKRFFSHPRGFFRSSVYSVRPCFFPLILLLPVLFWMFLVLIYVASFSCCCSLRCDHCLVFHLFPPVLSCSLCSTCLFIHLPLLLSSSLFMIPVFVCAACAVFSQCFHHSFLCMLYFCLLSFLTVYCLDWFSVLTTFWTWFLEFLPYHK